MDPCTTTSAFYMFSHAVDVISPKDSIIDFALVMCVLAKLREKIYFILIHMLFFIFP